MKHKLLAVLVLLAGSSLVACGGDDKGAVAGNTCTTNPTLPGCSLQKAALAQVPGSPEAAAAFAGKPLTPPGQLNQVPGGNTLSPRGIVPLVSNAQIQERAAKVAAAIESDKQNPDSPFYVPPKQDSAAEPERAPASIRASSISEVQLAPSSLSADGQATH